MSKRILAGGFAMTAALMGCTDGDTKTQHPFSDIEESAVQARNTQELRFIGECDFALLGVQQSEPGKSFSEWADKFTAAEYFNIRVSTEMAMGHKIPQPNIKRTQEECVTHYKKEYRPE